MELNINDHVPIWRELSALPTVEEKLARIADPDFRRRVVDSYNPVELAVGSGPLEMIRVSSVDGYPNLNAYVGRKLGEIAAEENKHVVDVLFDISIAGKGTVDFATPAPSGDDPDLMATALNHPLVLAGTSDGGAHSKFYIGGHWPTELIAWMQRDSGLISLEEIHARMSHDPARVAGIADRGTLLPGMRADLVVYDLAELRVNGGPYELRYDLPAGDWRRYRQSFGYRHILVNGVETHRDGAPTGAHPGEFVQVTGAARA
jgi:N-acyl-D-aspartate/D-glutamate deacylase